MRIRALLFLILLGRYHGPGATLHRAPNYQAIADAKVRTAVYVAALEHLAVRANIRYMAINYRTSLFHVPGDTTRELGVVPERATREIDERYRPIAHRTPAVTHDRVLIGIPCLRAKTRMLGTPFTSATGNNG